MSSDLTSAQRAALESDDLGQTTLAIVIAFEVGALVILFLRFYSRIAVTKALGRDDWLMLVGMLFSIGMGVCQIMQVQWGSGKHQPLLSPYQIQMQTLYQYWSIALYGLAVTLTKLSILLLYRRIFHSSKRLMSIVFIVGIFVVCFGVSIVVSGFFTCTPAKGFWNLNVKAECVNQFALFDANAAINIATDIAITGLPLPFIWRQGLPIQRKIGISFIFAIGWFVCAVSVLRLYSLVQFARNFSDATYYGAMSAWWSCIEVNTAIMAACMPPLRALISERLRDLHSASSFRSLRSFRKGSEATAATERTRVNAISGIPEELTLTPRQLEAVLPSPEPSESSIHGEEKAAWYQTPRLYPQVGGTRGIMKSPGSSFSLTISDDPVQLAIERQKETLRRQSGWLADSSDSP